MRNRLPSRHRLVRSHFLAVSVVWIVVAGCGGAAAPPVDPRPLGDGGILDRVTWEGGGSPDGADGATEVAATADAGDLDMATGDGTGGDDVAADASPGTIDAQPVATSMTITITNPTDGALEVAARRFAPSIMVEVTSDVSRGDDVKQVDADLWSTGAMAAKISTTRVALLHKSGPDGDGGNPDAVSSAPDGGTSGPLPGTSQTIAFSFGDTPIDLSALKTGTYELRVLATTLTGVTGAAARTFRADAGPLIRVIAPVPDQASRGSVFVSVEVIDPFSTTPPIVRISVANIPVTPLTMTGNLYQATVGETIAMPPLSGQQLLDVGATNAAGVAARNVGVRFVFDDVGPTIANAKPATGTLIGGIVRIQADVTDPAGVDPNTVVAVVGHGGSSLEVKLDRDGTDPKHFSQLFDTRRLSNTVLYPTISFRASDVPGNQSNIGYTVAVDNTPPLSDLDPPADLRVRRNVNGNWRCSWPFDPLGTDAVNDGEPVLQLFDVRARVEDEGNTPAAGGADITPLAGLDPAHVELLILDDTNRALVVDNDGDGICDTINPKLVPTTTPMSSNDALLVNLAPIPPTGAADFTADVSIPPGGFPDCGMGNDTLRPPLLCKTSDMSIAIPARQSNSAAVWSIPNVVPGTVQCVGNQFDTLGNHVSDGPACLAVHAVDRLGNAQVSRVLHVCVDHDGDGVECPYAQVASVRGGNPVQVTTVLPHGLTTGNRVLLGDVAEIFDANGLWMVTVLSSTVFILDGATTPLINANGGRFMRWTATSDCTGRQTAINPVVVDDTVPCRPWRRFRRDEHLDTN